jgi:hypothetical protein
LGKPAPIAGDAVCTLHEILNSAWRHRAAGATIELAPTGRVLADGLSDVRGVLDAGPRHPQRSSLRRSREMTILCSPKVTQHHRQVKRPLPSGSAVFARRASHAASRSRQHWRFDRHTMSSHKPSTLRVLRRGWRNGKTHAFGVDDIVGPSLAHGKTCSLCGSL